jgi:hypothetical protein
MARKTGSVLNRSAQTCWQIVAYYHGETQGVMTLRDGSTGQARRSSVWTLLEAEVNIKNNPKWEY